MIINLGDRTTNNFGNIVHSSTRDVDMLVGVSDIATGAFKINADSRNALMAQK